MKTVAAFVLVALAGSAQAQSVVSANADLSQGITSNVGQLASLRDLGGFTPRGITGGDTYGAAIIGQSTAGAAFITNTGRITTFNYDLAASLHGVLAGSGATVHMSEAQFVTGPNSLRVIVGAFTTNSSSLWINGLTIGGQPMTQGRFDVGAGAFTNGLLWDNLPDVISSVSITNAVFADGVPLATSTVLANGRTLPEMGSAVVWNGVVGSVVDETQMIFDITFVPTPGALALVGMGGLVALRRRR